MTLHEAIEKTIQKAGRPMTAVEIATELNKTKLYEKQDGSPIKSSQIGARVKNYPQWFTKKGSFIGLYRGRLSASTGSVSTSNKIALPKSEVFKIEKPTLAAKVLMHPKNFKSASIIDNKVPDTPGMYAIRVQNPKVLPSVFSKALADRNHNLIYIGIASQSLYKRMLGQELRARGHGTFFRSLGAMLGYLPPKGSLATKKNKRNYTFSSPDEAAIISWINKNLLVNWVSMDTGWGLPAVIPTQKVLYPRKSLLARCANRLFYFQPLPSELPN
jgi:hypothetical protein